ncbi:bifunctional sugar phosphate isomerase/epimerase/4-hydroxyphenylpyruvate dioxygenase family protein [Steroidobacter sp.]|uniref:bifunctional sugar phosphate isomerase/epimerase/4-hydroxyphenylpyruvate dioxygenase family protein n=1 Tax=Steroidobacter sp. TaxID=1978227 RepID=UPI001A3A134B|nr:sugar phosphate isomerase/epimerase and 4-hydroxyphenylpyruvate domain-containing protein [Steroidobacter sp.]MBL8270735.1 sugar phosphate isomerase/epimerase and 4-hydroxyphenylpyruvate domain-containing protein [Steroidobacter sp.]
MFTSIASVSISGRLDAKLQAIADAGFDGVELVETDLHTYDGTARDVGRTLRELGLTCTAFQRVSDFEGMSAAIRSRSFGLIERRFDAMEQVGTDLLIVGSNASLATSGDRQRIVEDFHELAERAHARGMRIGYEALAWGRYIFDHREAWSVVKETNHSALGLVLGSFHSLARNVPMESLPDIDPAKIFLVHLADAPVIQMDFRSWSRHYRYLPGQGELDLEAYVAALRARGYDGIWSLEIFNDRFRASAAATTAVDGMRSLRYIEDQVARRLLLAKGSGRPPRVQCHGIEFIEFAANDNEVEPLGQMFQTLGFTRTGQHRSKRVSRWSQNGINLLINNEPASFARAYADMHGASVCAIGARVEDVQAAMERAQALQINSFSQPVRPGELQIPAARSVGESLLYFIRDGEQQHIWKNDFVATNPPMSGGGVGLQRIDHLTQAMEYEAMLSWLLYYLSLFAVSKTAQVEIDDPFGLVYSQAVESSDRSFRIVLNSSSTAQTLSSRFLHGFMGAGVQHIALQSEDIFVTARLLEESGAQTLPIPANYYEDLQARYDLDGSLIERLAAGSILYERDGQGEYFQLFTRAFAKRFFFEIVQRRRYRAYGESNAAVRIAAQSRYRADPQG